jgi:hypothetical protein
VLGVDEFAFRKGCTYGTVLVDVEAGRVVDVLPDRTSETFAAWLTEHPGAEIICRDRATAYTKAVREAAPHALEVADRWHLLQNLSAAVEKTCHQHRDCLRKRAEDKTVTEALELPPMLLPPAELPRTQIIERTRHRYEDIHRLLDKRWTISAIARRLKLDRKTVRRFRDTDLDELPASAHERRPNGSGAVRRGGNRRGTGGIRDVDPDRERCDARDDQRGWPGPSSRSGHRAHGMVRHERPRVRLPAAESRCPPEQPRTRTPRAQRLHRRDLT